MPEGGSEIDAAIERVDAVRPELEDLRRAIVDATTRWVIDWWDAQVRAAIENDPWHVIDRLGADGVASLRQQVDDLVERAPALVQRRLAASDLWVHRSSIDDLIRLARAGLEAFERPYYLSGHGVQRVEEVLRRLAGELGPLLVNAGLGRYHRSGDAAAGDWRRATEGGVRYMRPVDYPQDLVRAMETYAHHVSALFLAVRDLDDLRRAQARKQAVALWEQA